MYSASDIIWIKNVKREKGIAWAYDDLACSDICRLHWSTKKKGSAYTPTVGSIIVLFQTPEIVNGRKNKKVHFTHLVSPISDEVLEDENNPDFKWYREVKLIAMTSPIDSLPNAGHYDFFLPNRGLTNPIVNLKNRIGLSVSETQQEIWDLFQPFLCPDLAQQVQLESLPDNVFGEFEGDKIIKNHITVEFTKRSQKLIEIAKSKALEKGNGHILCECCGFDFLKKYGDHGVGYIEGHHKLHLSTGMRYSTTDDIALVCSNCHRMLHRKNASGQYYNVEELSKIINQ